MGESSPQLFADPLWERQGRAHAAAAAAERAREVPLVSGLMVPQERRMVWESGERQRWLAQAGQLYSGHPGRVLDAQGWATVVQSYREGGLRYSPTQGHMFGNAPEELVRPLLGEWRPDFRGNGVLRYLQVLVARFEFEALPTVFHSAKTNSYEVGPALLPVLDIEVARLMADWLVRLRSMRHLTRRWFSRHGLAAVPLLVPDALGKRRVPREKATAALALIASEFGAEEVAAAAEGHGAAAVAGVREILRAEPPKVVGDGPVERPVKPPKLTWLDRTRLPRVLFRDGSPLSDDAVEKLLGAFALSPGVHTYTAARPYPDLVEALEYCDRGSLARWGQAIFDCWVRAGTPPRNGWVIDQFYWTADGESTERLGAALLRWPGANSERHAARVLAELGTDTALRQLHRVSQRVKTPGLRRVAGEFLAGAARSRGLTAEELADRLVPDLGLDARGTLVLDYGARAFTVGFDETLTPFVIDAAGKPRKSLPKPAASDDSELAPAAYQRFTALKKLARGTASDQIRRLERAMVTGRDWSPADFEQYLVTPPLIRHITRRLVFTTGDLTFRVAEDRTLADIDDAAVELADTARVRIAHPLELGDTIEAWGEVFADYEITQPFRQLDRPVYELTADERASGDLSRFADVTVPVGALLGLVGRGWERGYAQDGGVQHELIRSIPEGPDLVVELDPGIYAGEAHASGDQRLIRIRFTAPPSDAIGPVLASELMADLAGLAG
ncbi:DUF4132 domain-containing protein [Nocardia sp. NBC_01503]|uniref:DUF4132 domain-containing protein n=1 Tax=Nocardia sp. NBC_01503 TaxID=2975997 RepID=UPI002E7BA22B|nr:DUF4132 domain-containing protein [Nocardia sp. NBC_01503]WTL30028.1 DUF4132 domain-containing protein [Nocardia sp. NBC_01503]